MSIAHLLEDFGNSAGGQIATLTDVTLEEERLAAFERGYQAGWDDSLGAQRDEFRHIAADLAQNLRDLSFTYEEAYAAVLDAVVPVIERSFQAVLPPLSQQMLLPQVSEIVADLARKHGRMGLRILAAPADLAVLERVQAAMPGVDVTLGTDSALAPGQVQLSLGEVEHEIDMAGVLRGIDAALSAFFAEERKETA